MWRETDHDVEVDVVGEERRKTNERDISTHGRYRAGRRAPSKTVRSAEKGDLAIRGRFSGSTSMLVSLPHKHGAQNNMLSFLCTMLAFLKHSGVSAWTDYDLEHLCSVDAGGQGSVQAPNLSISKIAFNLAAARGVEHHREASWRTWPLIGSPPHPRSSSRSTQDPPCGIWPSLPEAAAHDCRHLNWTDARWTTVRCPLRWKVGSVSTAYRIVSWGPSRARMACFIQGDVTGTGLNQQRRHFLFRKGRQSAVATGCILGRYSRAASQRRFGCPPKAQSAPVGCGAS